ncbi:chalcone isomerase family protein [Pseudomonas sp. SA3-5]|uniref:Chalcone isomerase family protein n=1 Tax=Pseudomonas aestuarii TaxID=3018340 RepID=A0ABT4XHU5_9PSED|nr:chalcone isomerase family protein [Pseudomonas aestuarii]MDA7087791.1 chalcone isomerase family protein [Pseudomonas aestuarii]
MRRPLLLASLLLLSPVLLAAADERLRQANFAPHTTLERASLERKNQSVLRYLWVDVYAAALYAEPKVSAAQALDRQRSLRLELYYFRNILRSDVIEAAWTTLKRQHDQAKLDRLRSDLDALHASFRDIKPGDRYALNYHADSGLSLERNGKTTFASSNPELARTYLGIWLAPDGLSDRLRSSLLND